MGAKAWNRLFLRLVISKSNHKSSLTSSKLCQQDATSLKELQQNQLSNNWQHLFMLNSTLYQISTLLFIF